MGTVYLAKHISIDKLIAIKVLNSDLSDDEELKSRFYSEAKIQAHLGDIEGIASVFDFIEKAGRFYIFMEFLQGVSLAKHIKVKGALSEKDTLIYFLNILEIINRAHKKGVIHRDLKPSNIMITKDNTIKVMDFGIAKIVGNNSTLTKVGLKLGSPRYMSPEQVKGENLDFKTDIYSLGILLYEMLEGKSPYKNDTKSEYIIYDKIVKEPLPKLTGLAKNSFFQKIINKATKKKKEDRFENIDEFIQALTAKDKNGEVESNKSYLKIIISGIISLLLFVMLIIYLLVNNTDNSKSPNKIKKSTKSIELEREKAKKRYENFLKKDKF